MSVALKHNAIVVVGDCGVEQAEMLLDLIISNPDAAVDVSAAGSLHTALWQVMFASRPSISGNPPDAFIRKWVISKLTVEPNGGPT